MDCSSLEPNFYLASVKPCHVKGETGRHWPAQGRWTARPRFLQHQGGGASKEPGRAGRRTPLHVEDPSPGWGEHGSSVWDTWAPDGPEEPRTEISGAQVFKGHSELLAKISAKSSPVWGRRHHTGPASCQSRVRKVPETWGESRAAAVVLLLRDPRSSLGHHHLRLRLTQGMMVRGRLGLPDRQPSARSPPTAQRLRATPRFHPGQGGKRSSLLPPPRSGFSSPWLRRAQVTAQSNWKTNLPD